LAGTHLKIRSFVHKGLKKLYEEDNAQGVPPESADKLRKMFAFLDDMEDPEEHRALPSWKVHTLTEDREGTWSLSVTANRRLTFRIDLIEREIYALDLEDYH
jgi:proteic killer suppression protein